jgi:DNA-binding winged helix-turn-helix (wHTH) protein/tetratricopeptide (TPR) repeat protein
MTYASSRDKRPGSYAFGRFRLSDDGTLLLDQGAAVAVAPKVLRTLLVLIEHAGQVVAKDDLIRAVWPDTFVEEVGLTRNISVLRQILGDDGQRFIATIPRVGYRFIADVEHIKRSASSDRPVQSSETARPSVAHAVRERLTVGHRQERAQLDAAFSATTRGSGRLVAVSGEPGIGKSTIVEEFLSELREQCLVGQGRCSERLAGAEPHLAVLEALDELLARDRALTESLRRLAPTWYVHVAPRFSGGPVEPRLPDQMQTGSPERLMRELTVFLEEISRTQPIVMFIDDLHWSDVSTVDIIAHLAARLVRMQVMLIVAYRANEMAATNHPFNRLRGELLGRGQLTEVAVSLLTIQDVREYVLSLLGSDNVPPELPSLVYRKTEGHPLFMTGLVRYLQEHGASSVDSVEATREIPESLKGMIERSLQALDSEAEQLLRVAALHGNEFESAVVARVAGRTAVEVEEHLQRLARVHGLLTIAGEHCLPDGTFSLKCRFVHVLYQNALYASTTPSRRAEWARQIGETLAGCYGKRIELVASELALLFEIARNFKEAATHFLAASRTANRRFAFREASELARRGLGCVQAAGIMQRQEGLRLEFDLTFALFGPLASVEGYAAPEIERLTRRLLQLGEELGDTAATAAALAASWAVRMVRGECLAAKDGGLKLVSLGQSAKNDIILMNGHMKAEIACHHIGEFREAQEHADAIAALDSKRHNAERIMGVLDPIVASLAEAGRNLWIMGYLERAPQYCTRAVEVARDVRHPDSLAFAWLFHGWMYGFQRDWKACLKSAEAGITVASESGSVQVLAWNRCVRGWAMAHMGRVNEGLEELGTGIESSRRIMGQVAVPQFSTMMAEALLLRGDTDAAGQWLAQALELSNRQFDRYFDAELHRLSAICSLKRGQRDAARSRLGNALEVAQAQEAATFELRAALTLAEHGLDDWQDLLASVLDRFPERAPWPEIKEAERYLH